MQITSSYMQSNAADWVKKTPVVDAHVKKEEAKADSGAAKVDITAKSGSSVDLVKARADALPEVRENKVAVAKERIESGFYNTEGFSGELAAKLVEG